MKPYGTASLDLDPFVSDLAVLLHVDVLPFQTCSSRSRRRVAVSDLQFSFTSTYVFGSWRVFLLVCTVPIIFSLLGLIIMPESPRYLLQVSPGCAAGEAGNTHCHPTSADVDRLQGTL